MQLTTKLYVSIDIVVPSRYIVLMTFTEIKPDIDPQPELVNSVYKQYNIALARLNPDINQNTLSSSSEEL